MTNEQAREIKMLCAAKEMPQTAIAKAFDVSKATVSNIKNGKRWADIV